jgi:hypothetical protein
MKIALTLSGGGLLASVFFLRDLSVFTGAELQDKLKFFVRTPLEAQVSRWCMPHFALGVRADSGAR